CKEVLHSELDGLGIAEWYDPKGGYFISLNVLDGCAKRVWTLMKEAGVTMTGAGATFPGGIDPRDRNLRLAPTYTTLEDLALTLKILTCCVKLAAVEKLMK
ncbi:MAG: aminotransferase, partial [Clostridia bacterium]|nr:aminotransferase [Clostridia bacterium]